MVSVALAFERTYKAFEIIYNSSPEWPTYSMPNNQWPMGSAHMAVSHQFQEGNQARNHSHQKVCFWIVFAVFYLFWLSFGLVLLSLMGVRFVDSNRWETAIWQKQKYCYCFSRQLLDLRCPLNHSKKMPQIPRFEQNSRCSTHGKAGVGSILKGCVEGLRWGFLGLWSPPPIVLPKGPGQGLLRSGGLGVR